MTEGPTAQDSPKLDAIGSHYEDTLVPALFMRMAEATVGLADPRRGERALDVACGSGVVARLVAGRVGPAGRVVGLDVSVDMLDAARLHPPSSGAIIEWEEASAVDLPFSDSTFDLVTCQQGLQFVALPATALREMRRVLVPGGRLVLSVWRSMSDATPGYRALDKSLRSHFGADIQLEQFALGQRTTIESLLRRTGYCGANFFSIRLTAHFGSIGEFVEGTMMGSQRLFDILEAMDDIAREDLIVAISTEVAAAMQLTDASPLITPIDAYLVSASRN